MTIEIRATMDQWDAPFTCYEYPDGTSCLAREIDPPDLKPGWERCTALPHAQVWVNGRMSAFDAARQPADPDAERLRLAMIEFTNPGDPL